MTVRGVSDLTSLNVLEEPRNGSSALVVLGTTMSGT